MGNPIDPILGTLLADGVAYATANEQEFEAKITAAGITFAQHGEALVDAAVNNANLGPFLNPFKATIVSAINAEINSVIQNDASKEVSYLYQLALAAGTAEAKKLESE